MFRQIRGKSDPQQGLHGSCFLLNVLWMLDQISIRDVWGQVDTFCQQFLWCGSMHCPAGKTNVIRCAGAMGGGGTARVFRWMIYCGFIVVTVTSF